MHILRRILFKQTMNTRDIGGYPVQQGYTAYNAFIRSDAPAILTDDEVSYLLSKNIKTIVDLRSEGEVSRKPCFFADKEGFDYYNFQMSGAVPEKENDIPSSYMKMLDDKNLICEIMEVFAKADGGVIFHCTAGKDRTGVIAAILLDLAGVSKYDIVADYQLSYTYISEMINKLKAADPSLPFWVGQSKPEYMFTFLDGFFEKYGNAEAFLGETGLSKSNIAKIVNKIKR